MGRLVLRESSRGFGLGLGEGRVVWGEGGAGEEDGWDDGMCGRMGWRRKTLRKAC